MSKPVSRIKLNPAANTKRGQVRILDYFIDFIMNLDDDDTYHGFSNLKPIPLQLKKDPVTTEPVDPEEYLLHEFCALEFDYKVQYIEAFIVNIRKQRAMDCAFYYDISVSTSCFCAFLIKN